MENYPRRLWIAALFSLIIYGTAIAAPSHVARTYNVRDGLPSNSISCVAQDGNGLIWIGTWNGLTFYDGYRFFTFRSGEQSGELSTNRILDIYPDTHGNVWFVTYDHKLGLLDNPTGHFVDVVKFAENEGFGDYLAFRFYPGAEKLWVGGYDKDSGRAAAISRTGDKDSPYKIDVYELSEFMPGSKSLRKVVSAPDGTDWIITDAGIASVDGKVRQKGDIVDVCFVGGSTYFINSSGQLYVAVPGQPLESASPLKGGAVRDFIPIDDNRLAAATADGLAIYNIRQHRWELKPVAAGVRNLYVDSTRRVWLFTDDKWVMIYDGAGNLIRPQVVQSEVDGTIFSVPMFHEDAFGTVWVAPKDGRLAYYDDKTGRFVPHKIVSPLLKHTTLPDVDKFYAEPNGNLWLISPHGLSLVKFNYHNYKNLALDRNQETRSLAVLSDGSLMAGSSKGVIGFYDRNGRLKGYLGKTIDADGKGRVSVSDSPAKVSDKVYAIYQDKDRNVWVGTKGDGLYIISPGGELRHYGRKYRGENHIDCDTIYAFDTDRRGNLWLGTYGRGLYLVDSGADGSFKFTSASRTNETYPKDDNYRFVRRITHNDKGEVIASCNGGLLAFRDDFQSLSGINFKTARPAFGDNSSLRNANVMQVLVAADGDVYVTTMGGEVQHLVSNSLTDGNLAFESMDRPEYLHTLSNGNVLSMIQDKNGRFYFVRETDIVTYDPSSRRIVILGSNILGGDHEFSEALPAEDAEGNLYFGALGHIVKVNPDDVSKHPFTPNIIFTGLQLEGDNHEQFILNPENIELQPDRRNFSLSFAALDYGGAGHIEYAYRFEPDTTWTYLGTSNVLQVTNLRPGVQRLYIRSTNGDGTWVDNEKYVDILVRPTFWETIWAKIIIAIAVLALLFFIVHYYSVYRRNRLMAQVRKREHDFYVTASHKLRTPLSLIGSPVYEVMKTETLSDTGMQHLERVRRNAKNMLELLNDMLSKEFKLEDVTDDAPDNVKAGDDVRAAYMASENWLEIPREKDMQVAKDVKILIVEDNDDLRGFLRDILSSQYEIIEATNGKEGLEKAEADQPDFILTDVNMPEMDGLTMVKHIKENKRMSHIPIIVLSAKATVSDRVQGLQAGIDDYISKPFSATYLRQRIANIISQRRLLQQTYFEQLGKDMSNSASQTPATDGVQQADGAEKTEYRLDSPQIIEADQVMMEKLMKFLEERIGDENLRIEEMAEAVSMGRTVFYGKIKAIVGMSPSDFLRSLRMQRAEELIVKSKMNFSQIAFSVGFSDPKYFTKCFKKETGMTPSEYRQKKQEEKTEE